MNSSNLVILPTAIYATTLAPQETVVNCNDSNVFNGMTTDKLIATSVGSVLTYVGLACNAIILLTFSKNPQIRNSSTIYLQALALFDVGVLISYILLYQLNLFACMVESYVAYSCWAHLTKFTYPFARFCQMSTAYTMLVVNLQTLRVNARFAHGAELRKNVFKISGVALFCFTSHITRLWEIDVRYITLLGCGLPVDGVYEIYGSDFRRKDLYNTIYVLWYTNVANTLVPFVALVLVCVRNSVNLRRSIGAMSTARLIGTLSNKDMSGYAEEQSRLKENTKVLAILCVNYLVSNLLALFISMTEFIDEEFLHHHPRFYTISVEVINICAVVNSSCRIINYMYFNHAFRDAVVRQLKLGTETDPTTAETFV